MSINNTIFVAVSSFRSGAWFQVSGAELWFQVSSFKVSSFKSKLRFQVSSIKVSRFQVSRASSGFRFQVSGFKFHEVTIPLP